MKRLLILIIALISLCFAGMTENIMKDINYLASEACFGRNVAKQGIYNAEAYIVSELRNSGLTVKKQAVTYKLNQTLDTPVCVINGDTLRPGYDFIPHPFSTSANKLFATQNIEVADSAALEEIKESKDLFSQSEARRYLMKKSSRKDRNTLLLFAGGYPLMSKQSKQYERPAIQIEKSCVPNELKDIYLYNNVRYKKVTTHNIIATIDGTTDPGSAICLTAHYDHMGALGEMYYPGANDNASGTAVLLELARYFSEHPPEVTLVFCFFTGEEQGLKGSWQYVRHPVVPLKNTLMAINLDMVGSGSKGYGIVGGNDWPADVSIFEDIREELSLGDLHLRPNAPNSDHFPFSTKDVPALFFYSSGGEQPYHHPEDIPETLDWETIGNTVTLMKTYIERKTENIK